MASVADPENAVEQQEELRRFQCPRTKVEAVDIGVCANGHALLSRVSASFEPESVTAVLGESGCGKSALLRVIGGGRHDSGQILFNGCGVSRLNSRFLVYFLRDDCHFEALTVAQTLCYASMLRNVDSPKKRIGALMSLLSIKDEIVGNMPRGRRKLVSICAQLLSTRPVLVMDEPTTGLDAATAMKIVGVIRNAEAYETRTVIASLHQPSWLLLNAFTGVMVLANGRVVFHGSPTEMASYFDSFPSSQNIVHIVNPADRAIYALEEGEGDEDNDSTWAKRWEDARRSRLLERIYNLSDEDDEDGFDEFYFSTTSAFILSPWQQYKILAVRACHVWFQDSARAQTAYTLAILVSCFAGIAQFMSGWTPSKMNVLAFFAAGTFLSATLPSAVSQSLDCVVARREWQNGIHSTGSYWLAHCTVALASSFVVASLVIPIVSTTLALPLEAVLCLKYWIALVIHYFNCSVFGLLCGTLTSSSGAALQIMSISMASMFLTCGAIMPLHRMHTVFLPCRYPNLFTWYFRIILTLTFGHANDEAWELLTSSGYMDIDPGHEKMWWFAQLFIGVALILLGYLSTHITLQRSDKYSVEPDPLKVKIWRTKALVAPEDQAESRSESLVSKSKKEEKSYGAVLSMATGRREGSRISTYDLWFWHRGILNREKDKRFDKTTSQGHLAKATLKGVNVTFDASTATAILGPSVSHTI